MNKRVIIADVAREAGVSAQTVSRALNNKAEISPETRARVLAVVQRLGYRPNILARGLVTRKTTTIGLMVPDIANPFFSEVTRGAEDAAHAAGYALLLCNTMEDAAREAETLHALAAQRVDGIVLCSSRLPDQALLDLSARLPALVLVNRQPPGRGLSAVSIDDEAGAACAVAHLLRSGRRKIGFLAGPPASNSGRRRGQGYAQALAAAGLGLDPALTASCMPDLDGGRGAASRLLAARPDLDAFFCYNDLVATGALQACAAAGRRVPEDVAVAGCDDILLAGLVHPPLTTLRSDKRKLGAEAIRLLLAALDGCSPACEDIMLPLELIVRASAPGPLAP